MRSGTQRGAPAPLPHCGCRCRCGWAAATVQRGAPAPLPHCGLVKAALSFRPSQSTRGAGAPPSLRLFLPIPGDFHLGCNEGRRRPSLIAASAVMAGIIRFRRQRGAPAPLPHCGGLAGGHPCPRLVQRGAPAPLPHCGRPPSAYRDCRDAQRGAPAPLPHCGASPRRVSTRTDCPTRGAGAPPSLRRVG